MHYIYRYIFLKLKVEAWVLKYLGLRSKTSHKCSCSIASIIFLNETNGGVDHEQADDTDKVLPVRGLAVTVGECNGHDSCSFHNPWKGIPHEPKKLEHFAFLQVKLKMLSLIKNYWFYIINFLVIINKLNWTFFSSSLLGPNICSLSFPSSVDKPSFVHFSCSNTSSTGMRSCKLYQKNKSERCWFCSCVRVWQWSNWDQQNRIRWSILK